jgi:hypothetical protein
LSRRLANSWPKPESQPTKHKRQSAFKYACSNALWCVFFRSPLERNNKDYFWYDEILYVIDDCEEGKRDRRPIMSSSVFQLKQVFDNHVILVCVCFPKRSHQIIYVSLTI